MLIPIPYSLDITVPTANIREYSHKRYSEETPTASIPSPKEEQQLTERAGTQEKTVIKTAYQNEESIVSTGYSNEYQSFNVRALITKLINEFSSWRELDTDDALVHISNIKEIIHDFEPYMLEQPENRILVSTLELLFQNNRWENLSKGQINLFVQELNRFKEGNVDWDNLEKFSKQIYRNKITVIQKTKQYEEKTKV